MSQDTRIGSAIAGYRIESLLGRGGMSVVYLATQEFPKRNVALKLLAPELVDEPGFRERFIRESNAAASLDHPNVIPIYGAGEEDGVLWIAMRYVDGTDLAHLIQEFGPLAADRTVHIVEQVASALDAAHEIGLVHRDVKPGNVLLTKSDHAYLTDFGITKRREAGTEFTKTGDFLGTGDYAAPEQIKGEAVDGRADVYSLGCVTYECLTGKPPFPREAEVAVLYAHVHDPPPKVTAMRPDLPAAVDEALAKAMAKRADRRYASAEGLAAALLRELGLAAGQAATPTRPRRRIWPWAVAAPAVLVIAVALVIVFASGSPSKAPFVPGPNTVAMIDAATNTIVDGVDLGQGADPKGISYDPTTKEVWVANFGARTVTGIDPVTHAASPGYGVGGSPTAIATREGEVWIANGFEGTNTVSVFDPKLRQITGSMPGVEGPSGIAIGSGSVWVTGNDSGAVYKIDPSAKQVQATISLKTPSSDDPGPTGIAYSAAGIWVAESLTPYVARIDPQSDQVVAPVSLSAGHPTALAVDSRDVWVTSQQQSTVTEIDTRTNQITATFSVGAGPTAIVVTSDAVWVACSGARQVWRIDPKTHRPIQKIDVNGSPQGLAVVDGRIWVTVSST
jgi:YVTN family beta-propeller protein